MHFIFRPESFFGFIVIFTAIIIFTTMVFSGLLFPCLAGFTSIQWFSWQIFIRNRDVVFFTVMLMHCINGSRDSSEIPFINFQISNVFLPLS